MVTGDANIYVYMNTAHQRTKRQYAAPDAAGHVLT
jgi:hypothetical protein